MIVLFSKSCSSKGRNFRVKRQFRTNIKRKYNYFMSMVSFLILVAVQFINMLIFS